MTCWLVLSIIAVLLLAAAVIAWPALSMSGHCSEEEQRDE